MKVLLRRPTTGLFYAGQNNWTLNRAEAVDFGLTDRAVDEAAECSLDDVEILMTFDNPAFEIPLQIAGFGN